MDQRDAPYCPPEMLMFKDLKVGVEQGDNGTSCLSSYYQIKGDALHLVDFAFSLQKWEATSQDPEWPNIQLVDFEVNLK